MRNITKFENESLYETHMGGGDSVLPNVSWVKDINEVKYGRKVKRAVTFNIPADASNLIILRNCDNISNIKVNGVLTEPDENNQVAVTETGTYEIEFDCNSLTLPENIFRQYSFSIATGPSYTPCYITNISDDFLTNIKEVPSLNNINYIKIPKSIKSIYTKPDSNTVVNNIDIESLESWANINFTGAGGIYNYNNMMNNSNLYLNGKLITDFIIPETLLNINSGAFKGCSSITSVTIPDSSIILGDYIFEQCNNLESAYLYYENVPEHTFENTTLSTITIGDSVKSFSYRNGPTKINIPSIAHFLNNDILKSGLYGAFYNGSELYINDKLVTDIVIPSGITTIRVNAFSYYSKLKSITLCDSITTIDYGSFSNTPISRVNITNLENFLNIQCGAYSGLFNSETKLYLNDELITNISSQNYNINQEITTPILSGCSCITSIQIPSTIKIISEDTFRGMTALSYVNYENITQSLLETIDVGAFRNCPNLHSITLPSSLKKIYTHAFKDCTTLSEIICYATTAPKLCDDPNDDDGDYDDEQFDNINPTGTLKVPTGSDYSSWLKLLPSGWTIEYI